MAPAVILRRTLVAAGLAVFLHTLLSSPPEGLSAPGWRTLGVAALMAALWISEALPFAVTALLPLVLFPAAGVGNISASAAPFANPVIFLFLGGIFIAIAMERSGLHRRIALAIIGASGTRKPALVAGFLAASAFLSMWINNTAVAVMMLPIALSVLKLFDAEHDRSFAPAIVLSTAYGATIGGMATLVGTAPNAILAGFMLENYGIEIGFLDWMLLAAPLSLMVLAATWAILVWVVFRPGKEPFPGGHGLIALEARELGPPSRAEKSVALVFAATAALWITGGFLEKSVPWLTDTTIAMAGGLALFLIPGGGPKNERLLDIRAIQSVPWDVLLLIGGGLSLAAALQTNGVAAWAGGFASQAGALPTFVVIVALVATIILLTEITSNAATTSTFLPIAAALASGFGQSPLFLAAAVTLASSCGFIMPVGTPPNAIAFGSGRVSLQEMMRAGIWLNIASGTILAAWLAWLAPVFSNLAK
jgi:sodium-dependent dicarboxylate transporter 2/3/5